MRPTTTRFTLKTRPTTEAQREAARRNGRLSRGPLTAEGKRHSSQNATRHGMLADITVLENEDRRAFIALVETLKRTHRPQDETEHIHVETIASATWRLDRLSHIARDHFQMEIHAARGIPSPLLHTQSGVVTVAFRNMAGSATPAELILRYEAHWERIRARAFTLLARKQAAAEKRPQEVVAKKDPLTRNPDERTVPYASPDTFLPIEHAPAADTTPPQPTQPDPNPIPETRKRRTTATNRARNARRNLLAFARRPRFGPSPEPGNDPSPHPSNEPTRDPIGDPR